MTKVLSARHEWGSFLFHTIWREGSPVRISMVVAVTAYRAPKWKLLGTVFGKPRSRVPLSGEARKCWAER
jgi:hypothetical protein